MEFKPIYYADKVNIINPEGYAGAVSLWTKLDGADGYLSKLNSRFPHLLSAESPLVAITNLYGNGLPQMLANLAYNPQIERLAVTGKNAMQSAKKLINFFREGVEPAEIGGVNMLRIKGTDFPLDYQLNPEIFKIKPEIQTFKEEDLEGLANFLSQPKKYSSKEEDRVKIELKTQEFKDFPSDAYNHNLIAKTPLKAWLDVMFHLNRYGINVKVPEKGMRRSLFNVDVSILNPSSEPDDLLRFYGFNPEEIRKYQQDILSPEKANNLSYTYGNRLRGHFGLDSLEKIAGRIKADPLDRKSFVSLWDTRQDLVSSGEDSSAPCFTDAFFFVDPTKKDLTMNASFRTHNAVSAWLVNMYGLRAVQEYISKKAGVSPGRINVRSRWLSIDPDNAQTNSALALVNKHRRINLQVEDPKGYYEVTTDNEKGLIVAQHYNPQGVLLEEFSGKDTKSIKDQIRQINAFSTTDHAVWFGIRLEQMYQRLHKKESDI